MNKIEYFPLKVSLIFLIFTEALFWIGPNHYNINNDLVLALYLALMNIALFVGYNRGVKNNTPKEYRFSRGIVKVILVLGLIAMYRFMNNTWASHGLQFSFSNLWSGITNPGEAYLASQEELYHSSFLDIIVLSFFRIISIPLGIYYWTQLNKVLKGVVLMTITLLLITYLGVGIRKGLLDLVIYTFFIILAKNTHLLTSPKSYKRVKIIFVSFIVLFLFYFVFSIASRYGYTLHEIQNLNGVSTRGFYNEHLPGWLVFALQSITGYLCQGYYALALALEIGIKDIVLFSDNWVSAYYCQKLFGYDPIDLTYMADLEAIGIDRYINWHTMYLWLANQFTFIGVPFVVYYIGYFFAQSWNDMIKANNDYSVIVFSFFIIMVLYLYANNQVLSDSATSFWLWFILYILNKKNIKYSNK